MPILTLRSPLLWSRLIWQNQDVNPDDLASGSLFHFSVWPATEVPKGPPGVYTIWRGDEFLYVGISWREPANTMAGSTKGLWGRLDSHASGRRSGDQFCIYVSDRFVLETLDSTSISQIASARLSLDSLTRSYIRQHLSYRFTIASTGNDARAIEAAIRKNGLAGSMPVLNPATPPRRS